MNIFSTTLCASALAFGASAPALSQSFGLPLPELAFCDPFVENIDDDIEEEDDTGLLEMTRTRLYDQEVRETLTSEEDVMDALYEETWDLSTLEPIPRTDLCGIEPNYVIHWAEMTSRTVDGKSVLLAEGELRFQKDGVFEFVFNKRPYTGNWQFADGQMTLQADWVNDAEAVTAPVEKVETPVEIELSDGTIETYYEDAYRIGWLRVMRSETTARGQFQDCACTN